jgi:hypothetical protein
VEVNAPASPSPQQTAQKDVKNDFSRGTYVFYLTFLKIQT